MVEHCQGSKILMKPGKDVSTHLPQRPVSGRGIPRHAPEHRMIRAGFGAGRRRRQTRGARSSP